jgi:hypothetical protein
MLKPELIGQALTIFVVAGLGIINHVRGAQNNKRTDEALTSAMADLKASNTAAFAEVRADIAEVRSFCVGPDGQNGFRKEISDLRGDLRGLLDRERDYLAEERLHGRLDRRTG